MMKFSQSKNLEMPEDACTRVFRNHWYRSWVFFSYTEGSNWSSVEYFGRITSNQLKIT